MKVLVYHWVGSKLTPIGIQIIFERFKKKKKENNYVCIFEILIIFSHCQLQQNLATL